MTTRMYYLTDRIRPILKGAIDFEVGHVQQSPRRCLDPYFLSAQIPNKID